MENRYEKDKEKLKIYGYRVNENCSSGSTKIQDVLYTNKKWKEYHKRRPELEVWVRTLENPQGILDMRIIDPYQAGKKQYVFDQRKAVSESKLLLMKRPELVELAEIWDINPVKKKKDILIKLILQKMDIFKKQSNNNEE